MSEPTFENRTKVLGAIRGAKRVEVPTGTVLRWELECQDRRGTKITACFATAADFVDTHLKELLDAIGEPATAVPDPKALAGRLCMARVVSGGDAAQTGCVAFVANVSKPFGDDYEHYGEQIRAGRA